MSDPTIDQYDFSSLYDEKQFEDIQNLLNLIIRSMREQITIPKEQQDLFFKLQFLLGEVEPADFNNIQSFKEAISLLSTEMNSIAIDYLSKHFLNFLESGETKKISQPIIYSIIDKYNEQEYDELSENNNKKVFTILKNQEDPEIVIHFILGLKFEQEDEFFKEAIEYLTENLDDDIVEQELIRITLFMRQIFGLKENVKCSTEKVDKGQIVKVEFNGDELSGIFSHLKRRLGDDLEKNGALKLSGGGEINSSHPLKYLIQYGENEINNCFSNCNFFFQSSESDSWIEFDFVNRRINLESYTLRSDGNSANTCWKPKSWRIVGSNDHEEWEVIDHRVNSSELKSPGVQHRFENTKTDNYYRYIRYIQEEVWDFGSGHNSRIILTRIEFFGSISSPKSQI